jgi:hypothetical protein
MPCGVARQQTNERKTTMKKSTTNKIGGASRIAHQRLVIRHL